MNKNNNEWEPKLKNYPHFDSPLSKQEAIDFVKNTSLVAKHIFSPFLSYTQLTRKFNGKKVKERLIRYGSRKDSYIYSYYRSILLDRYNEELKKHNLEDCITAYRKIKVPESGIGKSNINFAQEAFEEIKKRKNCIAIAVDISKFFESLDHSLIKTQWKRILGVEKLSDDHHRVYRNITNYKTVDLDLSYQELGLMKLEKINNKTIKKFTYSREKQPKKLCSIDLFKKKIVKLIRENPYLQKGEKRGIPQGSPISDMVANMYMLDFDEEMKALADKIGGCYRRYSDDIMIICPPDRNLAHEIALKIDDAVRKQGKAYLKINKSKTIMTQFFYQNNDVGYETFDANNKIKSNAFEYLGFSFDGEKVLLKSQTVTNYYKKINRGVQAHIKSGFFKAKQNKSRDLKSYISIMEILHRYSNPNPNWKDRQGNDSKNFITYVKRSTSVMREPKIHEQIRNHKKYITKIFDREAKIYTKKLIFNL